MRTSDRHPHQAVMLLQCGWVVGLVLASGLAHAGNNELALRLSATFAGDGELAAVSEHDVMPQLELTYSRRLLPLGPGALWAEGSASIGGLRATLADDAARTDLAVVALTAGARYVWPVWRVVHLQARVGLGPSVAAFELDPRDRAIAATKDAALALTTYALGGIQLLWPGDNPGQHPRHRLGGGFVIEGGYSYVSDLTFNPTLDREAPNTTMPITGPHLGTLDLSGPVVRLGVVLQF